MRYAQICDVPLLEDGDGGFSPVIILAQIRWLPDSHNVVVARLPVPECPNTEEISVEVW
jgi:hypothetical protein